MTARSSDPDHVLAALTDWTTAHPIGDRIVPAHIAIRLATLDALQTLEAQGRIRPYRMGWRVQP